MLICVLAIYNGLNLVIGSRDYCSRQVFFSEETIVEWEDKYATFLWLFLSNENNFIKKVFNK